MLGFGLGLGLGLVGTQIVELHQQFEFTPTTRLDSTQWRTSSHVGIVGVNWSFVDCPVAVQRTSNFRNLSKASFEATEVQ